jgi:hypothetical protein
MSGASVVALAFFHHIYSVAACLSTWWNDLLS